MSQPSLEKRRLSDFEAELQARARAWIPQWALDDEGTRDFGGALLRIAARMSAEVAERLDRGADKMRHGFLDWLGVRGKAAQPARMPVAFKLNDKAPGAVLAPAGTRMQASVSAASVMFETEAEVRVVPGTLALVVGVDADEDAFYLPPPGLHDLDPLPPLPTQWRPKTFAAAGSATLQLDPELGLSAGMLIEIGSGQYSVVKAENGIVTLDPPLDAGAGTEAVVRKVEAFRPFDKARSRQSHALYLGHAELLNIEAPATLDIVGAQALSGMKWQYWGKADDAAEGKAEVDWQDLTPLDAAGSLRFKKGRGTVEPRDIGPAKGCRWIRAFAGTVKPAVRPLLRTDSLELKVNCDPSAADGGAGAAAEAMANTTPLAMTGVFYPLGREPKQFDAFYLGCAEAFSKKAAKAELHFQLGDATFGALSAVRAGNLANKVLAGIGVDGALHLLELDPAAKSVDKFREREPLRPPSPAAAGTTPRTTAPVSLRAECRPVVWSLGNNFLVAVAGSDGSIWAWYEAFADKQQSGWVPMAEIPSLPDLPPRVEDLVLAPPSLAALSNCSLWLYDSSSWTNTATWRTDPADPTKRISLSLTAIAPMFKEGSGGLAETGSMVAIGSDNKLYWLKQSGQCIELPLPANAGTGVLPPAGTCPLGAVRPAAVLRATNELIAVAVDETGSKLLGFQSEPGIPLGADGIAAIKAQDTVSLDSAKIIGRCVDVALAGAQLQFSVSALRAPGDNFVASWVPFDSTVPAVAFESAVPAAQGLGGSPLSVGSFVVVSGTRGDLYLASFDASGRRAFSLTLQEGVVLPDTGTPLVASDWISAALTSGHREFRKVMKATPAVGGEVLYWVESEFGDVKADPELIAYRVAGPAYAGTITASNEFTLDSTDTATKNNDFLVVEVGGIFGAYEVVLDTSTTPATATVFPNLPSPTGSARYWAPIPSAGRVVSVLELDPATNGNWDASILGHASFYFAGADPSAQSAKAFELVGNRPKVVALQAQWNQRPSGTPPLNFVLDGALDDWVHVFADRSSNPELSWEYWTGTGWSKLTVDDTTLNLKASGVVKFDVPDDLKPGDWAGKTDYWIRARLVGGDFGQEIVTIKSQQSGSTTQQTVERSTKGIRPPSVIALRVTYSICNGVQPTYVLAEDSGSILDQSDANRTAGAVVEAFVPLGTLLGRLKAGASAAAAEECPPGCDPGPARPACDEPPAPQDLEAAAEVPAQTGRAIYLGFDAKLHGAPVNVFVTVEREQSYGSFAPLEIAALTRNGFERLVGEDRTRALGESALLSLAFPVEPAPKKLFGRTLSWIRLTPVAGKNAKEWKPALRGAYLNAVWAGATETMTRELLGSSEGMPKLLLQLARPPVLHDTLELRVREPLGDEERKKLRENDAADRAAGRRPRVISDDANLPGDWVLWDAVPDTDDCGPTGRVYMLDEESGMLRFGDGQRGLIPPIGRDSIVAFTYQRTEPPAPGAADVPANEVAERATLNLVTPVAGVEAVHAAGRAAGGAAPEPVERVVRFGASRLRHRSRAVTARDFEDIALERFVSVVQARCFARGATLRLVVVMRGSEPRPSTAQKREIRRALLELAASSLAAPGALRIDGPSLRELRVELLLSVATLDHAGQVSESINQRLRSFFDTASGGAGRDGWRLGATPTENDVALALLDVPNLESVSDIRLLEIDADGAEKEWQGAVRPGGLAVLADDGVRIRFEPVAAEP